MQWVVYYDRVGELVTFDWMGSTAFELGHSFSSNDEMESWALNLINQLFGQQRIRLFYFFAEHQRRTMRQVQDSIGKIYSTMQMSNYHLGKKTVATCNCCTLNTLSPLAPYERRIETHRCFAVYGRASWILSILDHASPDNYGFLEEDKSAHWESSIIVRRSCLRILWRALANYWTAFLTLNFVAKLAI